MRAHLDSDAHNQRTYFMLSIRVSEPHLSKEGHSEVCSQQPLASVHHLHHFRIGPVERIIQVGQFLFDRFRKTARASNQHEALQTNKPNVQ